MAAEQVDHVAAASDRCGVRDRVDPDGLGAPQPDPVQALDQPDGAGLVAGGQPGAQRGGVQQVERTGTVAGCGGPLGGDGQLDGLCGVQRRAATGELLQPRDPRALDVVEVVAGGGECGVEQPCHLGRVAEPAGVLRGEEEATPARGAVAREFGGAFEGPDRLRRGPAPYGCRLRSLLQPVGDHLVRTDDGHRAVPDAAVRVGREHLGESRVGLQSAGEGHGLRDRGADEGMAEPQRRRTDGDQTGGDGGLDGVDLAEAADEHGRGREDLRQCLGGGERGDQHRGCGGCGQSRQPLGEGALEPFGHGQQGRLRIRSPATSHPVGDRQLEQRQRVAARFGVDPVPYRGGEVGCRPVQEDGRVGVGEPGQLQLGQRRADDVAVPRSRPQGPHDDDRVVLDPARDEGQHGDALGVEPVQVVDDDQDRLSRGGVGQQGQRRQADEERLGGRPVGEAERRLQRRPLHLRQPTVAPAQRAQQFLQPAVGHVGLGVHPDRPQNAEAPCGRPLGGVVEQGGLADPRLSPHQQRGAGPVDAVEQRVDLCALAVPADQRHPRPPSQPWPRETVTTGGADG